MVRTTRTAFVSIVFLAVVFFLSPIASAADEAAGTPDPGYTIGPEDVLEVSVWKEDALQKEVLVRPDGGFTFPLVGEVAAKGKTVEQVRAEIAGRLAKYIPDPVITVSLRKIGGHRIYVLGKANHPGEYVAATTVDVMQALSMAGGLTPYAARDKIKVLRREGDHVSAISFNYDEVEKGHNLAQDILLRTGDVVVVP